MFFSSAMFAFACFSCVKTSFVLVAIKKAELVVKQTPQLNYSVINSSFDEKNAFSSSGSGSIFGT